MEQGTKDWNDWRRVHITASRVAAIMGKDPWKGPQDIYYEMVEGKSTPKTAAMDKGSLLEPYARRAYEEYTGIAVEPLVIEHAQHSYIGASLDGINFRQDTVAEFKCPGDNSFYKMRKNGIPEYYWIQVQTQLMCVPSAKECHFFFILFDIRDEGDIKTVRTLDFEMIRVNPDPEFHEEILDVCYKFWHAHIVPKIPPPAKYRPIKNDRYFALEQDLKKIMELKKRIEDQEESIKEELISLAEGSSVEGNLTRISFQTRKGSIDEAKLKEMGINADEIRKPSKTYQSVTFIKKAIEDEE